MLRNINFFKSSLWLALAVILLTIAAAQAWNRDFVLELSIVTDKSEEFVLYRELNDREFRNLRNDPGNEIKPFLIEARRKYADEIGYRSEIYGDKNFQMVVISHFSYVVKDKSSGRILLSR